MFSMLKRTTPFDYEQNLVVEGCYVPFVWADDFDQGYSK